MRSIVFNCFLGLLARGALVAALYAPGQDAVPPRDTEETENPPQELLTLHKQLHDAGLAASGQVRRAKYGLPDLGDTVDTPISIEVYVHVVTGTQQGQDRASEAQALGTSNTPFSAGLPSDHSKVDIDTLPGGNWANYALGKTAVHECGHWLGLAHTFQGGCDDGLGDAVDDTPPEKSASSSCKPRDSCPHKPGLNPINNYMDYSPDSCMTEFTPGQYIRARQFWELFRDPKVAAPSASTTIQQTAAPSASI
ncbi:Extracellular metalloprotease [Beauveria bassiana D1-5]|uniref:Extracellular metalloprotease n=1 Tax=Beauveria bassiana D1-5 TaxID=1245745 RepID=A0A0A2VMV6_BEABA|nr:Extracellular metalloprotease [Beauveria bassiana D1-5]